jgi:hypothetical protein
MSNIRENMERKARIEKAVAAVDQACAGAICDNGIGTRKIAQIAFDGDREAAFVACMEAVQAGRLVAYRGRGGSFRRPEAERPHVQDEWGGRTGHIAGRIPAERAAFDAIYSAWNNGTDGAELGAFVSGILTRLDAECPEDAADDGE